MSVPVIREIRRNDEVRIDDDNEYMPWSIYPLRSFVTVRACLYGAFKDSKESEQQGSAQWSLVEQQL